jgi:hypothetical protein
MALRVSRTGLTSLETSSTTDFRISGSLALVGSGTLANTGLLAESRILTRSDYTLKEIQADFRDKDIEIIEAKKRLNRLVFGQAVAGADMFERQYRPWSITPVVVFEIDDPAIAWVCGKHGVKTVCPLGKKTDKVATGKEDE